MRVAIDVIDRETGRTIQIVGDDSDVVDFLVRHVEVLTRAAESHPFHHARQKEGPDALEQDQESAGRGRR